VIADTAPAPGAFRRLYFLAAGKKHAPTPKRAIPFSLPRRREPIPEFEIYDVNVRINPSGDDWGDQVGRTVSYIVEWFNRDQRKFPNDPDRYLYIWGFDAR
jgi:hypothetical protein